MCKLTQLQAFIWGIWYDFNPFYLLFEFDAVENGVYSMQWYRYPPNIRKYLVMIMMRTHLPAYLRGYTMLICSMHTFASVYLFKLFRHLIIAIILCRKIMFLFCSCSILLVAYSLYWNRQLTTKMECFISTFFGGRIFFFNFDVSSLVFVINCMHNSISKFYCF